MTEALICWFTGLSGAGKTTVAEDVRARLEADGRTVLILDGDAVRAAQHSHLGFSKPEIKENNRLIADLCRRRRASHDVILVPIISPFAESRRAARAALGDGFREIYCKAPLPVVMDRDTKGLYAKARAGEMDDLIGYSPGTPYEPPDSPDLVLDTDVEPPEASAEKLHSYIDRHLAGHER